MTEEVIDNDKRLVIYLSDDLHLRIKLHSALNNESISECVRNVLMKKKWDTEVGERLQV